MKVSGVVEVVAEDKTAIRIAGVWFNAKFEDKPKTVIAGLKAGDVVDVTYEKNARGYNIAKEISLANQTVVASNGEKKQVLLTDVSRKDGPSEREKRIARESCLKAAARVYQGQGVTPLMLVQYAKELETWVISNE